MSSPPAEHGHKLALEPHRVVLDVLPRALPDDEHLPQVTLTHSMTLEPVVLSTPHARVSPASTEMGRGKDTHVSTLLLADLTVVAQLLESLGLHGVANGLGGPCLCSSLHGRGSVLARIESFERGELTMVC